MANLEVLALDTTVPQIRAPGTGDGYAVPRDMTLSAGTTLTAPTVNATTVDATNVEVTNLKAKDGTAAVTIADSTGVATVAANPILNAGTANGVVYLDASKVATTGADVTYDGTTFKVDKAAIFNDSGANVDFRIEGDTDANLFFVDASTDRVGVGTNAPAAKFDVAAVTSVVAQIGTLSGSATEFATLQFYYGNVNSPHIPSKIYAKNVGNAGPGGTGAANLVIATADGFYNSTLVDRMTFTHDGKVLSLPVYDTTVGATNRDVFVDNTGLIGYVSSIRASKTNITDLSSPLWLLQLNPVSFNYRKKDENGKYTDEAEAPLEYGLIAEDTEAVNPELCFYDIVDGKPELRGVHYSKLMTPILKLVQEQQKAIASLQAEVAELKAR